MEKEKSPEVGKWIKLSDMSLVGVEVCPDLVVQAFNKKTMEVYLCKYAEMFKED